MKAAEDNNPSDQFIEVVLPGVNEKLTNITSALSTNETTTKKKLDNLEAKMSEMTHAVSQWNSLVHNFVASFNAGISNMPTNTNSKTTNVMDNTTITNQCRTGNEDTGISEAEFYANKKAKALLWVPAKTYPSVSAIFEEFDLENLRPKMGK